MENLYEKTTYKKPQLTRLSVRRTTSKVKALKETEAQGNEGTKTIAVAENTALNIGIGNSRPS